MLHPRIVATVFVVGSLSLSCSEDSCFIGDTEVATPAGNRRIAELAVGDEVYSFDHERGELVVRKVRRVFSSDVTTVCRVETSGGSVRGVTPSHPFFDARAGAYVALRDLAPNASLLRLSASLRGPLAPTGIERIEIDERAEPSFTVYNIEVEGPEHNYFADGVLVHNKSDTRPQDCQAAYFSVDFRLQEARLTLDTIVFDSGPWLEGPTVTDLVGVTLEGVEDTTIDGENNGATADIFLRVDEGELMSGTTEHTLRASVDGLPAEPGPCPIATRHRLYFTDGRITNLAKFPVDD